MLLEIEHKLRFNYDAYIHESHVELRVQPRSKPKQSVHEWHLEVGPRTRPARWAEDWLGNTFHWFAIADWHDRIEILCRSIVETGSHDVSILAIDDPIPQNGYGIPEYEFLLFGGPIKRTDSLEASHQEAGLTEAKSVGDWITRLSAYLSRDFQYMPAVTRFDSNTDEVLQKRAGVCQDFAHLAIGLARLSGIPARYVNGYLHQEGAEGPSQSHAWFELFTSSYGWVPYDPTHHVDAGECHVVVAYGRNYDDVPPNRGIYAGSASESLEAEVFTRALEATAHRSPMARPDSLEVPVYPAAPDDVVYDSQHPRHGSIEDQQQQQQQQQQS